MMMYVMPTQLFLNDTVVVNWLDSLLIQVEV